MAASDIDSGLWHAIVGSSTLIPPVNSDVYYFPRGHIENSSKNNEIIIECPRILCKVLSVRYLCTHSADQAIVKYLLLPIHKKVNNNKTGDTTKTDQNDIIHFSKILTTSDANNGGALSVPKFHADSIFPRLNFSDDPPVQKLKMFDTHHKAYEFLHKYRGTPPRHLLTTGWSTFVKEKRLVAGDSIVFMKEKSTGQLFIGVRRLRFGGDEGFCADRFRDGIDKAVVGEAFEMVYYPRMGMPDFVVRAEKVDQSIGVEWRVGMRVKMEAKMKDSSRMAWFQGTIESVGGVKDINYPWGMIQVTWDEPAILQVPIRVSPWQVECDEPYEEEHHLTIFLPSKKLKALTYLPNEEDEFGFPELTQSTSTHNSSAFHYSSFSSSMQGASLDPTHVAFDYHSGGPFRSFTQFKKSEMGTDPTHVASDYHSLDPIHVASEPMTVSTELNLGSTSRFENASRINSFQLFGQTIRMQGETKNNNMLSYSGLTSQASK